MPRPAARVLALLEILQNGGTRTAADLSRRLGVDERTVRRYVEHLIDLDIPVDAVRGRYGGYRLARGYRLPPLLLTDEEALAVLLGLVTGRPAAAGPAAVASAAAKLRRVLPKPLAARLAAVLDDTGFTAPPPVSGTAPDPEVLLRLADATRAHRPVRLGYTRRDGQRTDRTVHPYGLVAHSGKWYVVGADPERGAVRTFRLDRVASADVGDGGFAVPPGFDAAAHVLSGRAETPWRHAVSVRVQAAPEAVEPRLPRGIATLEPLADQPGWTRVRLRAERLDWLPGVLIGLDAPFVVDEPPELRARLRTLTARLSAATGD